jgi:hypothetical protein
MKKADNFDASKWLVENKITTQSRLNEIEFLELAKKEINKYLSKNNLGSMEDIQKMIMYQDSKNYKLTSRVILTTGEKLYFVTVYDSDLNLVSIEQIDDPYASPEKSSKKIKSKFPGINIKIEGDEIIMIDRRGEYSGFIEDNGTVSFSVVYDDMDDEFDEFNWKDILGKNHAFVKIADTIPTEVEAMDDYVMITVKASDLTDIK